MIPDQTAASVNAVAPLATTLPVELSTADRARVDAALRDSRAANTRAQYRSAWRGWAEWSALNGHATLPADPLAIAAYLAERVADGAAAATVRTIRAAIRAGHVDTGAYDPTGHDGVRRVLQGLTRQAAGRGRGQADPLTADDRAAILATASLPRRTGRGMESEAAAADRGATHKAIAGLFQGGLRRSEAAALRWGDVQDAADGRGIVVYVRRSKTDQDGTAADVRYLKNGMRRCASSASRPDHRTAVRVAPGWHRPGTRGHQRPVDCTAPHGSGQRRRHRGADHRPLRARRPCRRIDPARRTRAGDGQGGRVEVVTDGRPLCGGRRSRAGRRRYLPVAGARAARRTSGAPHPHRRPVDAPGCLPGPPGARTRRPSGSVGARPYREALTARLRAANPSIPECEVL